MMEKLSVYLFVASYEVILLNRYKKWPSITRIGFRHVDPILQHCLGPTIFLTGGIVVFDLRHIPEDERLIGHRFGAGLDKLFWPLVVILIATGANRDQVAFPLVVDTRFGMAAGQIGIGV